MSKEFVEKDSKVGYIVVIILLILVILGLGGFVGYKYYSGDKCNAVVEETENGGVKGKYELTYSEAEEYIEKIRIYNGHFYDTYLVKNKKNISNENDGIVTKEKVEDVLHKYFGKNVEFKHDNIKCYAGEVIYEYDEQNGYVKKEHSGHGGPGSLEAEIFYVSSEVNGNKVKFVTKNVYERFCSDICGPIDAYYATADDVFNHSNPVLKAQEYEESVRITRYNKAAILEKVPETTYNFIIEDNGNFYLESVSVGK